MLGRLLGMCMVFNIQWARLAFRNTYYFYPSFMLLFFFLLVADNQPVHYAEKNML